MNIEFGITFCCSDLQIAMVKREFWFGIDTNSMIVFIIDDRNEENPSRRVRCPYCGRHATDVVEMGKNDDM